MATSRSITLATAQAQYPHRFTMEHVPTWAARSFHQQGTPLEKYPNANKEWPAPQYKTDLEWYENTAFPGEKGIEPRARFCESNGQTWPLGQRLAAPFKR